MFKWLLKQAYHASGWLFSHLPWLARLCTVHEPGIILDPGYRWRRESYEVPADWK